MPSPPKTREYVNLNCVLLFNHVTLCNTNHIEDARKMKEYEKQLKKDEVQYSLISMCILIFVYTC